MKALNIISRISLLLIAVMGVNLSFAQEYDDLYFNSSDRKKVAYAEETVSDDSKATYEAYTNNNYADSYSAHNVNPDYIARYQSGNKDAVTSKNTYNQANSDNANYSTSSGSTMDYYDDQNKYANGNDQGQTIINNNYYGNNGYGNSRYGNPYYNNWNSGFNNWYNPGWSLNSAFSYSPYYGWGNSWSISFGFGNNWNRWNAFYDPFYSPFYSSWNSPWYGYGYGGYGYGYGSPYYGGWRNNYYNGFYDGYYSGLYGSGYYYNDKSTRRNVVVAPRSGSRGGYITNSPRSSSERSTVSNVGRSADNRDFTRTQNEYFSRASTSGTTNSRTVATSRSSDYSNARVSRDNYSNSRSTSNAGRTYSNGSSSNVRTNSGTTRRYSSGSENSRSSSSRYSTPNYNSGRSSSGSSNYNRSSNSSGRSYTPSNSGSSSRSSYSTPSRSSSSSSSGRSYTPSSSGSSGGSSSRSGRGGR